MVLPIIAGIGQAGLGILGAFQQYGAAQQQADTANEARTKAYEAQLKEREFRWRNRLNVYAQQVATYNQNTLEYGQALNRGYVGAQRQLTDVYRQMRFQTEQQNIQRAQDLGRVMAGNRAGSSAARAASSVLAAYGRNRATMAQNLLGARNRYAYDVQGLRRDYQSAMNRAYSQVATPPQLGPAPEAPTMVSGPSKLGLFADIAQAGLSGMSTYNSLKAPNVFASQPSQSFDLNQNFYSGSGQPFSAGLGFNSGLGGSSGFNLQGFGNLDPLKFNPFG